MLRFAIGSVSILVLTSCTPSAPPKPIDASGGPASPSAPPASSAPEAGPAPAATQAEPVLPGSAISIGQARASSTSIVVAKIVRRGDPNPDAPSEAYYSDAKATIVRVLLGKKIEGEIVFSYKVKFKPAAPISESPPNEGEEYVLFVHAPHSGQYAAHKIVLPSAANISETTAAP